MTQQINKQLLYDKLTKSIKTKSDLAGWPDYVTGLDLCMVKDYSDENLDKLKLIESSLKTRVANFRIITNFFKKLTNKEKAGLTLASDDDLKKGLQIINKCSKKAKMYEEEKGKEITDLKVYLSNEEKLFFKSLFSINEDGSSKNLHPNADVDEEYLTEDELFVMYGEASVSEVNKQLNLNISISN